MSKLITLIILTFLPFLELRASIPYGVFQTTFSYSAIILLCVIINILLAPLLYLLLHTLVPLFCKIKIIDWCYQKTITKTQRKVRPYVKKYGVLGLAFFIAVPLPGSGVYSGALGAYLLNFKFRDFLLASIIGVIIAAVLVLLISVSGSTFLQFLIKN